MLERATTLADRLALQRRQRQILLELAGARSFISVTRLADRIWQDDPDGGPDDAEGCLHAHVSRLRKSLAGQGFTIITSRNLGYRLQQEPDHVAD